MTKFQFRLSVLGREVSGFTLTELLVALAVIAVLAAVFAPMAIKSQASARRVQCGSNLRQLGLAGQMYWDENGGDAFRWRGPARDGGQIYWFGWLESGPEGSRVFDPALGALFPYLGGRTVELCPAFRYLQPRLKLKATGASYGYGYNLNLSAPDTRAPVNIQRLNRPAELVFLADAAQVNTFQFPASPDHPMLEEFYFVSTNDATAHFRHSRTANAVFCDGHVAAEKPASGSLDPRLPTQWVGRLRSEILVTE